MKGLNLLLFDAIARSIGVALPCIGWRCFALIYVAQIGVKVAVFLTSHKKSHDIVHRAHNRLYISQVLTM